MSACNTKGSCSWSGMALRGLLGALAAAAVVFSVLVLTHKEPSRGHF